MMCILCILQQYPGADLVLVSVDGGDPREVPVLHGDLVAGLLAVQPGLEVDQSSVPASQVGDTGHCNQGIRSTAVNGEGLLTLVLGVQIVPTMKTCRRKKLSARNSFPIELYEQRILWK